MKRVVFGLSLTLIFGGIAFAQKTVTASSTAAASQTASSNLGIESGTQVSGQLQSTLDVQKARVGDQVLLKTTKAVKQNGQTVISKGSVLKGRVTDVAKKTKGDATSRIGVVFDRLQQGRNEIPINAIITSVFQANTSAPVIDDMQAGTYSSTSTQSSSRSSGGGVLGGVGSTVGSVVSTTTQTVGNVAGTTGQIVGNTTSTVTSSVKGLSISPSTSASAQGGSTLSMTGSNLKLEKGTTFNLSLSGSAAVKDQ